MSHAPTSRRKKICHVQKSEISSFVTHIFREDTSFLNTSQVRFFSFSLQHLSRSVGSAQVYCGAYGESQINHFPRIKTVRFVSWPREIMRLSCGRINTSLEHARPADFVQSQWQRSEKNLAFVLYRWIIAGFYVFSVLVSLAKSIQCEHFHVYFIYLTHWNLCFTMVSMVQSAWLTTAYYRDRLKINKTMTRSLKVYWFLSTSSNMYAFLVTIIYWTVLYKTEINAVDLNNIVIHCTNSLMLIVNMAVVKQPERFGLFLYPLTCGFIYLAFTWLYPFLGGRNKYDSVAPWGRLT